MNRTTFYRSNHVQKESIVTDNSRMGLHNFSTPTQFISIRGVLSIWVSLKSKHGLSLAPGAQLAAPSNWGKYVVNAYEKYFFEIDWVHDR